MRPISLAALGLLAAGCARSAPPPQIVTVTRLEPGIRGAPTMRLAGPQRFQFVSVREDAEVRWSVDRQVRTDDGVVTQDEALLAASGREVELDLVAAPARETVYRLRASDGRVTDTAVVRVFPAGARATFLHESAQHPALRVFVAAPPTLGPGTRVLLVLHDSARHAGAAADAWVQWGAAHGYLVIAPEFTRRDWPGARGYELGNVFAGDDASGALQPEEAWLFTAIEGLHRRVRREFALDEPAMDLYGHGAGARVVHRFPLFRPRAPVGTAIAAGAGWYTLPDTARVMPHGIRAPQLAIPAATVRRWTRTVVVLLRDPADPTRDGDARAAFEQARRTDPGTRWRVVDVPGVADAMVWAAQEVLGGRVEGAP